MRLSNPLRRLLGHPLPLSRRTRSLAKRVEVRPSLEVLEERLAPSVNEIINVNSANDTTDFPAATITLANVQNKSANVTLLDAINAANNDSLLPGHSGDTYTINLKAPGNIYTLTQANYTNTPGDDNWYGPNGLPPIASNIIINGNAISGATIERAGFSTPDFRLFYVSGGFSDNNPTTNPMPAGSLTLNNVTLSGGVAVGGAGGGGSNTNVVGGGGAAGLGGGIFSQGTLILNNVMMESNTAQGGAGGAGALVNAKGFLVSGGGGGLTGAGGGSSGSASANIGAGGGGFSTTAGSSAFGGLPGDGAGAGFNIVSTAGGNAGFVGGGAGGTSNYGGDGSTGITGTKAQPGDGGGGGGFATPASSPASPTDQGGGLGQLGGNGDGSTNAGDGGGGGLGVTSSANNTPYGGGGGAFGGGGGGGGGFGLSESDGGGGGGGGIGGGGGGGGGAIGVVGSGGGGGGGFGGGGGGDGGSGGFGGGGGGTFGSALVSGIGGFGGGSGGNNTKAGGGGGGGGGLGGAIFVMAGTATITNSTITGNSAVGGKGGNAAGKTAGGSGAAGGNGGDGYGGGLFNLNGAVTLNFDTIAGNSTAGGAGGTSQAGTAGNAGTNAGGAVYNLADGRTIAAVTPPTGSVVPAGSPTTASLSLQDNILADNGSNDLATNSITPTGATGNNTAVVTGNNNLVLHSSGTIGASVIIPNLADPKLSFNQLASNPFPSGGQTPTQTLAITPTSPAYAQGVALSGVTTDQRGLPRPSTHPSLGAFEPDFALTTSSSIAVPFSAATQNITLSASVLYGTTPVTEGTVTFTIENNQGGPPVGTATATPDSTGTAAVSFTLPAGLSPGVHTIEVSYSDPSPPGLNNFADDGDTSGTLTVGANAVTTTARALTLDYSSSPQNAPLTAAVTSGNLPITEGSVLFTLQDSKGNTIGTTTSGAISTSTNDGINVNVASASYTLPGGLAVGNYTIQVAYSDTAGNFTDVSDQPNTLSIVATPVTTTAQNVTAGPGATTVNLTATVAGVGQPAGMVGEGTVTFKVTSGGTLLGTATSASVSKGTATTSYTLPAGLSNGSYSIQAVYSDPAGNFLPGSSQAGTLSISTPPSPPSPPSSGGGSGSSSGGGGSGSSSFGSSSPTITEAMISQVWLDALFMAVGFSSGNSLLIFPTLTNYESVLASAPASGQSQLQQIFLSDLLFDFALLGS